MNAVLRWRELAETMVARHGIDPELVLAIIAQESAGNRWAWRQERGYRYLWNVRRDEAFRGVLKKEARSKVPPAWFHAPPGASRTTEWAGQQSSFGLMQVMGAVAREYGYAGPFLTGLCDPEVGVKYGVHHLVRLRSVVGDGDDLLACYNGGAGARGGNRGYVAKVQAFLELIRGVVVDAETK